MGFSNLNEEQVSEVLNVGVTSALDTLSSILGSTMKVTCGQAVAKQIKDTDFTAMMPAMCFTTSFNGGIQGRAVAIFRKIDLTVILSFLMNDDNQSAEFDEMGMGMLKEILSQMSSELASKLADFYGVQVTAGISDLVPFEKSDLIAATFGKTAIDNVLIDSFLFEVGSVLKGRFVYAFDELFVNSIAGLNSSDSVSTTKEEPAQQVTPQAEQTQFTQPQAPATAPAPNRVTADTPAVNIAPTVFPKFAEENVNGAPSLFNGNMNLLMEVPMNVSVEIGKTKRKMKDIMNFTQGTVIPIDKQAGAPVDITVNGQLIARGDVIVIDDNFGVRITELVGNRDLTELN